MEHKNKCKNVGFSIILWAVIVFLLCATPDAQAITYEGGGTYNVTENLSESVYINGPGTVVNFSGTILTTDTIYVCLFSPSEATLNFSGDAYWIKARSGSCVNLYNGIVDYAVTVYIGATVTVYGDHFIVEGNRLEPPQTLPITAVLTSYDAGDEVLFSGPISCVSGASITLAELGGPPSENNPPEADAGPDITVFTKDIASTVITGTATDEDVGDTLQYRWIEGSVEFTLWAPVGANGEAPLSLGDIVPEYLSIGTHTLTLEVTDGKDIVSDDMVLTIEIAPITIDIKPGSYPNSINLGSNGVVPVVILSTTDFDATDPTLVNPDNVFLAGSGVRVRGKGNKFLASEEDVDGDGLMDLVVKVETENLDPGLFAEGGAYLTINEADDPDSIVFYRGWDEITIVPPE